jgi:hypothetical protein
MNSSDMGRCSAPSILTAMPFHSKVKVLSGQSWKARWKFLSQRYGLDTPHRYQTPSGSSRPLTCGMFGPTSFEYSPFRHEAQCFDKLMPVTCLSHKYLNGLLTVMSSFNVAPFIGCSNYNKIAGQIGKMR